MRGEQKAKKARLESHDIDAPTGPFPYGPPSLQHVAEKAGDSTGICFVDLVALALRDSKAEGISMKVLSLCKDELPWPQDSGLCWRKKIKIGKEVRVLELFAPPVLRGNRDPKTFTIHKLPQIFFAFILLDKHAYLLFCWKLSGHLAKASKNHCSQRLRRRGRIKKQ